MNSTYLTSAQKATQLPAYTLPEVAFIGRSNCGKSSLLNTLLGRKNLARSSSTPGRTQMVNFFSLQLSAQQTMVFADLPGYGFNVARHEIRDLWDSLLATYLDRDNICEFLYLIDIRRSFEDFELSYMQKLGERLPLVVVLTKADKVSKGQAAGKLKETIAVLTKAGVALRTVIIVSNLKRTGIPALQELIFAHARTSEAGPEGSSDDGSSPA